jgi:asparagine synthase (glutamine-hydrolysing)
MCGIYGSIDLKKPGPAPRELLERMSSSIVHRGPDDVGAYFGDGVALGMRRLSIIDLSSGHQPICNEDQTVWVVLNGEIYNFQPLRSHLEQAGHRFATNSDTEVIVHLYEQDGLDFVKSLRGMFAIGLWDAKRSRLVLARDRLGKKPLYIWNNGDRLLFASEIKAILQDDAVPRRLNHHALPSYLGLGYVPAPGTLFEGIEKVLPAGLVTVENGTVQQQEYWDVSFDRVENRPEQEWVEQVREKFLETVKLRLISDVPLGAFLSGGIDSSAVVAAMSQLTGRAVKTYSIGFEGQDSFYNELPYANLIAKQYATDHHEIIVRPDVAELLPKLLWHLDEPIADSAFVTTYLVSKLARESVTVILSGVGGDELFGGYRRYLGDSLRRYYGWIPGPIRRGLLPAIFARLPQDRGSGLKNFFRYANGFLKTSELPAAERYISYITVLSPEVRQSLLNHSVKDNDYATATMQHYFERVQHADSLNQNIYLDMKTSLPDDLLLLTDKASMAASIECRAPFIDHELVELSARIPSTLKIRGLQMKYLLKKAFAPWLPEAILNRSKRGFGAPVGSWMRDQLNPLLADTLSPEQVRQRGLFRPEAVNQLIADHKAELADHTDHLLALVCLELWCRIFLDNPVRVDNPATCAVPVSS